MIFHCKPLNNVRKVQHGTADVIIKIDSKQNIGKNQNHGPVDHSEAILM